MCTGWMEQRYSNDVVYKVTKMVMQRVRCFRSRRIHEDPIVRNLTKLGFDTSLRYQKHS